MVAGPFRPLHLGTGYSAGMGVGQVMGDGLTAITKADRLAASGAEPALRLRERRFDQSRPGDPIGKPPPAGRIAMDGAHDVAEIAPVKRAQGGAGQRKSPLRAD